MDDIFGYLPPTANPPSKRPLMTLLKQVENDFADWLYKNERVEVDQP